MRLIVMGTGGFAVPTLERLATSRHEVILVVTRPPRGRRPVASPVEQAASRLAIEIWQPETVNADEAQRHLDGLAADLLVVCDYGEILQPAALATTRLGGINLHGSLLPRYRGAAPVQWAVWNDERETGNSVIHMTPGLDAGPCLGQQTTPIGPRENAQQLEERLAGMGADLVLRVVDELAEGDAMPIPQDAAEVSRAPRLKKHHGVMDWSRTARELDCQVRALIPWPRAFTFWIRPAADPLRISVDRAQPVDDSDAAHLAASEPGSVVEADKRLVVQTGGGLLELLEVQPAGKRSMPSADFLRGNRIRPGERLS